VWGTDGSKIFTLDDGWVWLFTAVEHWNAGCVGWRVAKVGSLFAALEPIAAGIRRIYGALQAGIARGLALRMDHGTQYLSDHFLKQVRFWGVDPSFGFLREPETNGVAERFHRTLKEQAIHGRVFRNIHEVRGCRRSVCRNLQPALARRQARAPRSSPRPARVRARFSSMTSLCPRTGCATHTRWMYRHRHSASFQTVARTPAETNPLGRYRWRPCATLHRFVVLPGRSIAVVGTGRQEGSSDAFGLTLMPSGLPITDAHERWSSHAV
jgi:transposase InsO family protein